MVDTPGAGTTAEPPFDEKRWFRERRRRDAERAHDRNIATISTHSGAAIASGQAALRSILLINGGAAAAMLAFIGSLVSVVDGASLAEMAASLIWFAWGVAAAVIAMVLAYLADYCSTAFFITRQHSWRFPYVVDGISTKRWERLNASFQVLALAAGLASIGLFVVGMLDVEASIRLLTRLPE